MTSTGPSPTATATQPLTRTEWIDRQLRAAILSNDLGPGDKLVTTTLAERWQVSPTPLRESLKRLAADGLVELTPHGSARVAPLSLDDAREVYELRLMLEPQALRRSVERTDHEHRALVRGAYDRLTSITDVASGIEAHQGFHAALLARCDSRWLLRITALLAEHAQRYATASTAGRGGSAPVLDEHRELRDAVIAGDADRAEALLAAHLQRSVDVLTA